MRSTFSMMFTPSQMLPVNLLKASQSRAANRFGPILRCRLPRDPDSECRTEDQLRLCRVSIVGLDWSPLLARCRLRRSNICSVASNAFPKSISPVSSHLLVICNILVNTNTFKSFNSFQKLSRYQFTSSQIQHAHPNTARPGHRRHHIRTLRTELATNRWLR
jgi:hypothetical protein